jgi:hypothetical protein
MFWKRSRKKAEQRAEVENQARREAAVAEARSFFESQLDADGVLQVDGMGKVFVYMAEHTEFREAIMLDLFVPMQLALAQGGRFLNAEFLSAGTTSLMLREGERALYDAPAYLLKEVVDREARFISQGISVPLGHGMRYRIGMGTARPVTLGSHWTDADEGALTLTDKRLVYHGRRRTLEFRLDKLASLAVYGDAIAIGVTNRSGNSHFRVGTPEFVAGLIQGAVSHLGEIVVIQLQTTEAEDPEAGPKFEIMPPSG